jgi:hypothetical protein
MDEGDYEGKRSARCTLLLLEQDPAREIMKLMKI